MKTTLKVLESTSISIVNGRVTRTREVTLIYRFELVVDRAGPIDVPAFEVVQGEFGDMMARHRLKSIWRFQSWGMIGEILPQNPDQYYRF